MYVLLIIDTKKSHLLTQVGLETMGLALDAAGGQTAGQVLFNGHEQDNNGNNCEDGSGEQVLPFDDVVAVEDVDTDSHGWVFALHSLLPFSLSQHW